MTERVLIAGIVLSTLAGCVPVESVSCPSTTEEVLGSCVVACAIDDECLIDEICDAQENACVQGHGDRPVIRDLRASQTPVTRGRPVHVFYTVEGATRVSIDQGTLASSPKLSGEVWTLPINADTVIELVAFGPGGRTRRALALTVTDAPAPPTIVQFTMSPEQPRAGDLVTIAWTVAGARRVSIVNGDQEIHSTTDAQGTVAYFPTTRTMLKLIAENDAGQSRAEIEVAIEAQTGSIDAFEPSTQSAAIGQSVDLAWRTRGAVMMQILAEGNALVFRSEDLTVVAGGTYAVEIPAPMPETTTVKYTLVITGLDGEKMSKDIVINVLNSGN